MSMFRDAPLMSIALPMLRIPVARVERVHIVTADPLIVSSHWVGRSVLCAGDDCPLCGVVAPRGLVFMVATWQRHRMLFELSGLGFRRLLDCVRRDNGGDILGSVLNVGRKGRKSPLRFEFIERLHPAEASIAPLAELASAVGTLYALPRIPDGSTLQDVESLWREGVEAAALAAARRL